MSCENEANQPPDLIIECNERTPLVQIRPSIPRSPPQGPMGVGILDRFACNPHDSTTPVKMIRNYSGFFRTNTSPRMPGQSPTYGWSSPLQSPIKVFKEWAKHRRENRKKTTKGKASNFAVIVNLICLQLGSGTLTLPWVAAGSSIFGCVIITILAMIVMYYASTITVQAVEVVQVYDMCKLLGNCNRHNKFAVEAFMYLTLLFSNGACLVGYMVILADFITPAIALVFGSDHAWSNRYVYIIFNTIILLPLCLLENLDKLKYTSILSVAASFFVMAILISDSVRHDHENWCGVGFGTGYVSAFNIIVMSSCSVQMCAVSIYENMENRTVKDFQSCLLWAFLITAILFAGFFVPGYQLYGESVSSNVFNNMPLGMVHNFARFVMFIVIVGVYPLLLQPLVTPYRRGVFCADRPTIKYVVPVVIVISSGVIAMCGFDLGAINSINGAFSFVAFIAVIPVILGVRFLSHNRTMGNCLILLSAFVAIFGFFWGSNNFEENLNCFLWGQK